MSNYMSNYMITDAPGYHGDRIAVYHRGLTLEAARKIVGRKRHLCVRTDADDYWFSDESSCGWARGRQPSGSYESRQALQNNRVVEI